MATIVNDLISYLQCGSTIAANDAIYIDDITGKIGKYDPLNSALVFAGIAKEGGVLDDFIRVVQTGRIKGFLGLTPGQFVYASVSVPGGFQLTEPSSSQKAILGIAKSATELTINGGLGIKSGGEGGGVGGVDILFVQDFENATIADFSQTGLVLETTNVLKGQVSAKLTHNSSVNQFFKQVIPVDQKFRNKNLTLKFNILSTAAQGNVVVNIYDETNAANLVAADTAQLSSAIGGAVHVVSFDVPATCASLSYTITALPEAGSPVTTIDDVIAEITSVASTEVLVQEADSTIRLDTANGYGSTATKIRRFTNIRQQLGSDILYQDSAVNGASFTALTAGIYHISYNDNFTAAATLGLTRNASSLTTDLINMNVSEVIAISTTGAADFSETVSWAGYLNVGDVIRANTHGTGTNGAAQARTSFTMSKQSSLKQVNVNPNSKITIPTSELRMEGASTRGTGSDTAIVRFDNIAKIRGDAFEVVSNATVGTVITMKKKGKLDVSSSIRMSGIGFSGISKNQQTRTAIAIPSESLAMGVNSTTSAFGFPFSADCFVEVGDVIRVFSQVALTSLPEASLNLSFQEQEIAVSVTNILPQFTEGDSSIRVDTANGYGSTATRIRRFSNVRDNIGNDIEYVASSVDGDSFVVKSAGIYHVSYTDNFTAGQAFGISKNASSLSTSIVSLLVTERLAYDTSEGSFPENTAWQGYLEAGDIIRPHGDTGLAASVNDRCTFTISKVGKPNITGVDVTPFVNIPQPTITEWADAGPIQIGAVTTAPTKGTISEDKVRWRQVGQDYEVEFTYQQSTAGTAGSGDYLVNLPSGIQFDSSQNFYTGTVGSVTNVSANAAVLSSTGNLTLGTGNTGYLTAIAYDSGRFRLQGDNLYTTRNVISSGFYPLSSASISYKFHIKFRGRGLTATNPNILTAPDTFSTDTASLTYAPSSTYTLATLANAPVGTYITFTYAANTNTRTQTTTRPTQTDENMNVNGMLLFTRAFNAASTAGNPSTIAIQIGKGLKGKSLDLYKSVGKVTSGQTDFFQFPTQLELAHGIDIISYNEVSGIIIVDAGDKKSAAITSSLLRFSDATTQTSGYLVINASKNPALVGLSPLVQRVATIKDVKANNTQGGASTTTYSTRVLNTLEDPTGIISSLASNQFTLSAGEYYIDAAAPYHGTVDTSKARLQNITDGTTALLGSSSPRTGTANLGHGFSPIVGRVILSSTKVFEIQQRTTLAQATSGFGVACNFGDDEVYTTVKITKIK
jgi:hypothetical protein